MGVAGGGTDVSPYSDTFGGCVLNATINMYANCTLVVDEAITDISFEAKDLTRKESFSLDDNLEISGDLPLHRAVYRRIVDDYCDGKNFPVKVITYSDSPPGSGLGSSSTMVVAMIEAFRYLLGLPLGEYDVAQLAFEIERTDCGLSGGKQDQYAATFGGVNFIEFYGGNRVIVNPLRIHARIFSELESSLLLFYTGASRDSATIIKDQMESIGHKDGKSLEAMHQVKEAAFKMKELLLKGDIDGLINEMRHSWEAKKNTSKSITNPLLEGIEKTAFDNGAKSLKVSGAGGGGFMMIFVDPIDKPNLQVALRKIDGQVYNVQFVSEGCTSWTI